jgi:hypothetical protein
MRTARIFLESRHRGRRLAVFALLVTTLVGASGCPIPLASAPVAGPPTPSTDEFEPNDDFSAASPLTLDSGGKANLTGTVSQRGDVDVFSFARLEPGDRILAKATTPASNLDIAVAIYDSERRIVYTLDDDDSEANRLDASADFIIRRTDSPYYLVVTHSGLADRNQMEGSYELAVSLETGHAVPPPTGQTLLLNYDGGEVNSTSLGRRQIAAFNANAISTRYRGQTGTLKELILETVEQNFERFNVTVITSDMPPPAASVLFTTIMIGGFNDEVFGIAEAIDQYNLDLCDDAIIYSESFSPFVFSTTPTPEALGIAIGNIAAHEAGHLLGLNHVDDDLDLMDEESPADAFLADQEFQRSPLSTTIMPLGTQDGAQLLEDTVGSRPQ